MDAQDHKPLVFFDGQRLGKLLVEVLLFDEGVQITRRDPKREADELQNSKGQ